MTIALSYNREEVQNALQAQGMVDLGKWRKGRIDELQPLRDATAGGEQAKSLLAKGAIETPNEFMNRTKRFRNVPLCGFGAAAHAWLLYGQPNQSRYWLTDQPIPDVVSQIMAAQRGDNTAEFEDSQQINEWFKDIRDDNNWGILSVDGAYNRIRDGVSALKIWVRPGVGDAIDSVGMGIVNCEDAYPIYSPDDPQILVAVAEAKVYGYGQSQTVAWRIWTADEWYWANEEGGYGSEGERHAFGRPPFAFFGNWNSMLQDALLDQKELIQRESIRLAITQSQGFSYFQMNGKLLGEGSEADSLESAVGGVRSVGTDRIFHFKDKDGSIQFVNPNAPLDEHRQAYESLLANAFRVSLMLPGDLVLGDRAAEQPTTIQWHWLISKIAYTGLVREATAWEDDITRILEPVAAADPTLPAFQVGELDWEHVFKDNPIPTDAQEERLKDQADVNSGNMLKSHYIAKWVLPDGSPDEIKAYIDELEASKGRAVQNLMPQTQTAPVIPAIQNRMTAMMQQGNGNTP